MKVPVLTYHSTRVHGRDYGNNDHVALSTDLRILAREGFRIVPLSWVVDWVQGMRPDADLESAVAISFDDGCTLDYRGLVHPEWGPQPGFFRILSEFREERRGRDGSIVEGTAFVIASPAARRDISRRCYVDESWAVDDWWAEAAGSGLISVQNHSWDHNHPEVEVTCQRDQQKGRFDLIETFAECDAEVTQAAAYIHAKTGVWPDLFAYPLAESSTYLREVFFPSFAERHRTRAAFSAHDGCVTRQSPLWALPRVVLGANWTEPEGLVQILREARES